MAHQHDLSPGPAVAAGAVEAPTTPLKSLHASHGAPLEDTPMVMKVESRQDTKLSRSQISTGLRLQANLGNHLRTIPDLDVICLGGVDAGLVGGCLESLLATGVIKPTPKGTYDYPSLSAQGKEVDMYPPLISLLNSIGDYFESTVNNLDTSTSKTTPSTQYKWVITNSASTLKAPRLKRYPDLSMVLRQTDAGVPYTVGDILIPLELKRYNRGDATTQVIEQYRAISSIQINRRFSYAISLRYPQLTLWHLDRANAICSRTINMKKDPKGFIHIIGSLMSLDYSKLGYYQNTWMNSSHPGGPSVRFQGTLPIPPIKPIPRDAASKLYPAVDTESQEDHFVKEILDLEVESTIKEPRGWIGRCTYVAKVRDPSTGKLYVIKVSWQDPKRVSEGTFYVIARMAGVVTGLAEIVGYQELPLISNHRAGIELGRFEDRRQCRLLLATIGTLLEECTSTLQLLEAVRDAVTCHRDLFRLAGLLHRDVSYYNVLINSDATTHSRIGKGLLIDLEYAKKVPRKGENINERHSRTGTLSFMATALLAKNPPLHEVHHDLESFLWVLLYTCSDSPIWSDVDPLESDMTPTYELNDLFRQHNPNGAEKHRYGLMMRRLPIVVSARFSPLGPYLSKLRSLFVTGQPDWPILTPGVPLPTYESFLQILYDAIDDPTIQGAKLFGPEDKPVPAVIPTMYRQAKATSTSDLGSMLSTGQSSQKRSSDVAQITGSGQDESRAVRRRINGVEEA